MHRMTAAIQLPTLSSPLRFSRLDRTTNFGPEVKSRGKYIGTGRPSLRQEGRPLAGISGCRESMGELAAALSQTHQPRTSEN